MLRLGRATPCSPTPPGGQGHRHHVVAPSNAGGAAISPTLLRVHVHTSAHAHRRPPTAPDRPSRGTKSGILSVTTPVTSQTPNRGAAIGDAAQWLEARGLCPGHARQAPGGPAAQTASRPLRLLPGLDWLSPTLACPVLCMASRGLLHSAALSTELRTAAQGLFLCSPKQVSALLLISFSHVRFSGSQPFLNLELVFISCIFPVS